MKNTFGNVLTVTIFGESHGPAIGAVLDGLSPGIPVSEEFIRNQLLLRRPQGEISTARQEADEFEIVSGVFDGKTTGTPLTILIPNQDARSRDYSETRYLARPGHADYTTFRKYHGYEDYRGGGHQSGRITAAIVAAGAILLPALREKGIRIGTHIRTLGAVSDHAFSDDPETLADEIDILNRKTFAVLSEDDGQKMQEEILQAKEESDSVGGILETAVTGLPAGLGEPWFDSMESLLSHALFSIPGVKGVEFGDAFDLACGRGSAYNDAFYVDEETQKVRTETNHNGGINGGLTNGMPVMFRTAVKPTPSIFRTQKTVDFQKVENAEISLGGRHDPAIIHRARVVQDSVTALVLADLLCLRYGTDYLGEKAEKRNIVLIGMSGAGKTSVGKALAASTGREFLDTDAETEKAAGMMIPEIFRTRGEAYFRDLEAQVIREIAKRKGCIISTGGGVIKRLENLEELRKNGVIVFLKRDVRTILPDVNRPLADTTEKIEQLYLERLPVYERTADLILFVDKSPQDTAEHLLRLIRED